MKKLTEKFKINYLLLTPYHSQTNGLVECFNRTLCESLAKLSLKNNDWNLYIAPTLFAYCITKHSTTKIELFYLVYGRSARLPVDEIQEENLNTENDWLLNLIDCVLPVWNQVKAQVSQVQSKQKNCYDKTVKQSNQFQIGNRVLYFNVVLYQSYSGKFNPKWKGSYIIQQVLPHEVYKLQTMDEQLIMTPINGNLLKTYHQLLFEI